MDKNNIKYNNTIKFKKNKAKDKKLRELDTKLYRTNKKIDVLNQKTFLFNRTLKDINEESKKFTEKNSCSRIINVVIQKIKLFSIKLKIIIIYLCFKFFSSRKNEINKKISKIL